MTQARLPQTPQRTSGARWFMYLSIGCGGLLFVSALIAGGAVYWAFQPGTQYPTAAVVSDASTGVVVVSDLSTSDAALDLLAGVFQELDEATSRGGGDPPEWMEALGESRSDYRQGVSMFLPLELTLTREPGPDDGTDLVVALNPRFFARLVPYLLTDYEVPPSAEPEPRSGGSRPLYIVPDFGAVSSVESTLVRADTLVGLDRAVGRLREGTGSLEGRLELAAPDGVSWQLRGMWVPPLPGTLPAIPESVERVEIGAGFRTTDEIEGQLRWQLREPVASADREALDAWLAATARAGAALGLEARFEILPSSGADALDIEWSIAGLRSALPALLQSAESAGRL